MDATDRLFGEIAVKLGHLSREQLAECIRTQYDSPAGTTLGQIALTLGFMQPSDVELVLTQQSRLAERRASKPRVGIVEIDATQSSGSDDQRAQSDERTASSPNNNVRDQARNARTQPNQPPIAAAYRTPSSAKLPVASPRQPTASPAAETRSVQPGVVASRAPGARPSELAQTVTEGTRPLRRADRTLVGTAPSAEDNDPAHQAITVIPPPDYHLGDDESGGDPEVSFESLVSKMPPPPTANSIRSAPIAFRTPSTPPGAAFDDPEVSFGALMSMPPKAPATGTIHGVGAPQPLTQLPGEPSPGAAIQRPRGATMAFSSPSVSVDPVVRFSTDTTPTPPQPKRSGSGTMQHFRAVTPMQPDEPFVPRRPSTDAELNQPARSLTPTASVGQRGVRAPRRASAWFSSLPAPTPTAGPRLDSRTTLAALDVHDAALAQLPGDGEPYLLRAARAGFEQGATDVHLHRGAPIMTRVHGGLQPMLGGAALSERAVDHALAQSMTDTQWRHLGERGEVMFAIDLPGVGRVRVSAYRSEGGCDAVMRLIPSQPRTLTSLGLPVSLSKLLEYESGLILCTGPRGSGVTTTLGALVGGVVNARQGHVVTLEEIIELRLPNTRCLVSQRQLGTHTIDMARAVRSIAHEDVDLVAIGELRNAEDIALSLSLAHGGHLVVAGVHARGAADCLNRLMRPFGKHDQSQARSMLARSLRAVIAQHLVMRADGTGRVPAIELIVATPTINELIRQGAPIDVAALSASGKAQKLVTLEESLQRLVASGTVDAAEAERVARNQTQTT